MLLLPQDIAIKRSRQMSNFECCIFLIVQALRKNILSTHMAKYRTTGIQMDDTLKIIIIIIKRRRRRKRRRRLVELIMPSILSGMLLFDVVKICDDLYIRTSLVKVNLRYISVSFEHRRRTALFLSISLDLSEVEGKRTDVAKPHFC